jgi:hypothetical protein
MKADCFYRTYSELREKKIFSIVTIINFQSIFVNLLLPEDEKLS